MGKLFVLYGPPASGKSEIQRQLTSNNFLRIVTSTTRTPRENEKENIHYIFMGHKQFEENIKLGNFIEWMQYNNEYYGTLKSSIEGVLSKNYNALIILDLAGVISMKNIFKDTIAIFIGANIETIKRRLEVRGTSPDEIAIRIQTAEKIELDYTYINLADAYLWNNDGIDIIDTISNVKEKIALFTS